MLEINLNKLVVSPSEALAQLRPAYEALRAAAIRENNLRAFAVADLALVSMDLAGYVLAQPLSYIRPAHYLKAEPTDTTEDLLIARLAFGYQPAAG